MSENGETVDQCFPKVQDDRFKFGGLPTTTRYSVYCRRGGNKPEIKIVANNLVACS